MRYRDRRREQDDQAERQAKPATTERTVIYCRISLDAAGEGLGVERQEAECRELCKRNGWEVSDVLVDNDISATTGKARPGFELLVANPPTRIVTWHTDRLVRLTSDLERVLEVAVPVHTVTAGDLDLATPAGRAVARTITAWATYEGEQKSLRQKASHRQRAKSGRSFWNSRRPFGFTAEGPRHETEAEALRECFDRVRQGDTFASCAQWLTDQGFTTTRGERWDGSRLSRTMRHPRNAGLIVYQDEIVGHGDWEPIVSEEAWRAIAARSQTFAGAKATGGKGHQVQSLLGGIASCGDCGDKVRRTRQHSKRKSGETVYTYIYQPRCNHVSINAEWLDDHVRRAVLRLASSPARHWSDGPTVAPQEAQEAAAQAVELRERLDDIAKREALDELTREQANTQTAIIRERLAKAEQKAVSYYSASPLDRAYSPAELIAAWGSEGMSLHHRREAVTKFLGAVVIRPRLQRNERANAGMVTLRASDKFGGDVLAVPTGSVLRHKPIWPTGD